MTTCNSILPRLTAYLDGELTDDDGSAVRGHLRECEACRTRARDQAALRDALRALPPMDPPGSLWTGIQARLAAAEVDDAHTPAWRRAVRRWWPALRRLVPAAPQLALAGGVAAAAGLAIYLHGREPAAPVAEPAVAVAPAPRVLAPAADVTAELATEPARQTASYAQAIDELTRLADEARPRWADDRRAAFDARLAALSQDIARAADGRPRQRAQRALIRYLQGAVVRDDVVLAAQGGR